MHFTSTVLLASTLFSGALAHTKRAADATGTDTSTTYLPAIVADVTSGCLTPCTPMGTGLSYCANQGTEVAIATCLCNSIVLQAVQTCVVCIENDTTSTNGPAAVTNYNAFVNQCISVSLANSTALLPAANSTSTNNSTSSAVASSTGSGPVVIVTSSSAVANSSASATQASATTAPSIAGATITFTGTSYIDTISSSAATSASSASSAAASSKSATSASGKTGISFGGIVMVVAFAGWALA